MSRYHGRQGRGAARRAKIQRRAEAIERQRKYIAKCAREAVLGLGISIPASLDNF